MSTLIPLANVFAIVVTSGGEFGYLVLLIVAVVFITVVVFYFLIRKEARRIERAERHQCANCGYDLRATKDCCPECGLPVKASAPRPAPLDPQALLKDWPVEPIEPRAPAPGELPAVVHSTRHSAEAELVLQHLRARGVWCRLEESESTELSGKTVVRVLTLLVTVPSVDEEIAKQILDRFRKPIPSLDPRLANDTRHGRCR